MFIAVSIVVVATVRLTPWRFKFPQWTRNIIEESIELEGEISHKSDRPFTSHSIKLLTISFIGLFLQLFTIFHPAFRIERILPTTAWAIACIITATLRPSCTPKALLVLYCSLFISQTIVLASSHTKLEIDDVPFALVILTAIGAILIIINMPLRPQNLPTAGISPVYGLPNSQSRTPEDNLTLWRFMTVAWMAPLMSVGSSRQLNDEDVWDLGYEFKHSLLSEKFRELKGSVLKRLLVANGLDLVVLGFCCLIELSVGKELQTNSNHN